MYLDNYAEMTVHTSSFYNTPNVRKVMSVSALRKYQEYLNTITILVTVYQDRKSHVVGGASDFEIGCSIMQYDTDCAGRVVRNQTHQLHQLNVTNQRMKMNYFSYSVHWKSAGTTQRCR